MSESDAARPSWTFFTNHARVLAAIARDPEVRVRDIAATCLLTERAVQGILTDLEDAGYLTRTRIGRRNAYHVTSGTVVRHPADLGRAVADALDLPDAGAATNDAEGDKNDTGVDVDADASAERGR
ncbi:helix-turn-helix domain-containing protein [Embleya sp. NBC_00896]|uniref:helix-turn-helix transcriptional regulator n=1 Tax=Embleya sp. NBC_00896 TaxID=2975961 RepID=UPI002F91A0D1|nr:MarR family transcriptional regulator [Embleya sp. NBC_00896]